MGAGTRAGAEADAEQGKDGREQEAPSGLRRGAEVILVRHVWGLPLEAHCRCENTGPGENMPC